jgi:hypothetical protein
MISYDVTTMMLGAVLRIRKGYVLTSVKLARSPWLEGIASRSVELVLPEELIASAK